VANRLRPLVTLTIGFIIVAALVFAAVAVSRHGLWAFPVVVSMWTAFLWILIGRGVAAFSAPPHRLRRVVVIVVACGLTALAALALSLAFGLLLVGPQSANLHRL
jgi:hypothetical protein